MERGFPLPLFFRFLNDLETSLKKARFFVFLSFLYFLPVDQALSATIARVNSAGNLFIVKLEEDEKFTSGDKVFVIINGQMKTTGILKFEDEGTVSLRVRNSINTARVGDYIQLSHDQSWVVRIDAKNQLVTGTVAKISGDKVFIKMDEKFQPVFGLKQPIEIQIDETLQVVPAYAMEYRNSGIWFKSTGDTKKLTEGMAISFPPPPRTDFSVFSLRRRFKDGGTQLRFFAGAQQTKYTKTYSGLSLGVMGLRDLSISDSASIPLGVGVNYYKIEYSFDGGKSELTQASLVFQVGVSFRLTQSLSMGPHLEYQHGMDGNLRLKSSEGGSGGGSEVGSHAATASGLGLFLTYQFNASMGLGLELNSVVTQSKVNMGGQSSNSSGRLMSERLMLIVSF